MAYLGRRQPFRPLTRAVRFLGGASVTLALTGVAAATAVGTIGSTDPSVVLLVGAETAIVDESGYARTLTPINQAARTTAQAKYGSASLTFDGSGDRVQAADAAELTFGSGDFTVETWARLVTKTNSQALLGQWDPAGTATNCSWFFYVTGGQLDFRGAIGGSFRDVQAAWTPTLGQWYHLAADRVGTTVRVYIDGAVIATDAAFSGALNNSTSPLTLGQIGTGGAFASYDYNGQLDEVRVTVGLARYAGAFTPPTGPFPRPADGVALATTLSGTSAAGAVGSVTTSGAGTAGLSGVSGTGAVGTVSAGGATTRALTGVTGTGAVGTLATARSKALTGVSGTGAVGTVTAVAGGGERVWTYIWGPV